MRDLGGFVVELHPEVTPRPCRIKKLGRTPAHPSVWGARLWAERGRSDAGDAGEYLWRESQPIQLCETYL